MGEGCPSPEILRATGDPLLRYHEARAPLSRGSKGEGCNSPEVLRAGGATLQRSYGRGGARSPEVLKIKYIGL